MPLRIPVKVRFMKVLYWLTNIAVQMWGCVLSMSRNLVGTNPTQATYVALRKPSDERIDWNLSSKQVYNFIRAQTHSYPDAFCLMPSGETLRIWKAKVFPHVYYGSPGQVVMVKKDHVVVTCGNDSAISLYVVQLDGQDEQDAVKELKFGQRLQ